jgi:natural product precursor
MELKKLKLKAMDITPLSERELSKVLGGFVATSSATPGSATVAPSASASNCNGNDVDVTNDSDKESD